jgi:CRISPR-associated protein Cas1
LCEAEVPIAYFSMGGWFYGVTQGLGVKNTFLRREQFRLADVPGFCLRLARALVAGKIVVRFRCTGTGDAVV